MPPIKTSNEAPGKFIEMDCVFSYRSSVRDKYEMGKLIKKGTTNTLIYEGVNVNTKEKVAIKVFHFETSYSSSSTSFFLYDDQPRKAFKREVEVMRAISSSIPPHPNVVKILDHHEGEVDGWIIMEFCNGGDLLEYMQKLVVEKSKINRQDNSGLSEIEARSIFVQVVNAVAHAHKHGIVHRDIKLENVFINRGKRREVEMQVKLGDWGLSVGISHSISMAVSGTMEYLPPECLLGADVCPREELDVWSLGVLLYTLCSGRLPFSGKNSTQLATSILTEKIKFPKGCSAPLKALFEGLLNRNINARLNLTQILAHSWISGRQT